MWPDQARPQLARGVRLRWDAVREQHTLLRPEGALTLNASAAAVLELCNGERDVADILRELESRYAGAALGPDVRELLARLADRGLVVHAGE